MFTAGGIFRTDIRDGEIKTLTRLDGFQASGVSFMRYVPHLKILIIGYNNGMLELLKNDQTLTQVNGFYSKLIQGDKRIIHINVSGDKAIISTTFGILVLDLLKEEISDRNFKYCGFRRFNLRRHRHRNNSCQICRHRKS
jgi:hypothetical protein